VRRPDLVRGVVLEDPAPLGPDEVQVDPEHARAYVEGVVRSRSAPDDAALLRQRREDHPDWPESELLPTGRAEQDIDLDYLVRGDLKPSTRWPELVSGTRVPLLVVTGDLMDEVCVDTPMEEALRATQGVEVLRIRGAGHCVRRDQPEVYYQAVDRWLGELPEGP
jgi:pimeloyl-ACP methyl ester carboxylesterase